METIQLLLVALENKLPASLKKRVDAVTELHNRLKAATDEFNKDPSDANKQSMTEITEYIGEVESDLIEDLQELVDERKTPTPTPTPVKKPEGEEKDISIFGIVLGAVLLVGSFGAIRYFGKK